LTTTHEGSKFLVGAIAMILLGVAAKSMTGKADADGAGGGGGVAGGTRWTSHAGFQRPAPDRGQFVGDVGNSHFALSDNAATAMGLPRGSVVPWREGIPDFGSYTVQGPEGIPGTFNVRGLVGDAATDRQLIIKQMASESGLSQRAIQRWLSKNDVNLHHAGGDAVQIVPSRVHSLHHSGGAQQLRSGR
jgi:hypothetical protein